MSPNSQVKASLLCFIPMSYMPGLIVCALDFASSASASKPDRGNCFCVPGQNTGLAQCHSLIESVSGYHWTVKQPDRLLGSGLRWTSNTSGLALHDTEIGASKHRKQWVMQSSLQVLTYSTRQAHVFLVCRITILSIPKIKNLVSNSTRCGNSSCSYSWFIRYLYSMRSTSYRQLGWDR